MERGESVPGQALCAGAEGIPHDRGGGGGASGDLTSAVRSGCDAQPGHGRRGGAAPDGMALLPGRGAGAEGRHCDGDLGSRRRCDDPGELRLGGAEGPHVSPVHRHQGPIPGPGRLDREGELGDLATAGADRLLGDLSGEDARQEAPRGRQGHREIAGGRIVIGLDLVDGFEPHAALGGGFQGHDAHGGGLVCGPIEAPEDVDGRGHLVGEALGQADPRRAPVSPGELRGVERPLGQAQDEPVAGHSARVVPEVHQEGGDDLPAPPGLPSVEERVGQVDHVAEGDGQPFGAVLPRDTAAVDAGVVTPGIRRRTSPHCQSRAGSR